MSRRQVPFNYFKMVETQNQNICMQNYQFITELNCKNNMVTPFLHTYVHKKKGGKIKYTFSKLVDGVHPTIDLDPTWAGGKCLSTTSKWWKLKIKIFACKIKIYKSISVMVLSDQSVHITHAYCCVSKFSKFWAYLYSRVHNKSFLSLRNSL
jgi:hypothetical protein